jgi:hypothetical protein
MNTIKLTEAEAKLVSECLTKGCHNLTLIKSETQFKVEFTYESGNAVGSRSIIYDWVGYLRGCYENVRKLEDQLFRTL